MALTPGSRLGAYEVISSLGAGGMGEVYRARDTRLDRDVALNILPPAFAADPERLRRFEREAKTLASLNHPNIAQLYGIEESESRTALVMELVPGRTLAEIIDGGGAPPTLSIEDAIRIAAQIAGALEAAHEAGIVHRDLKPANVKVRDDEVVKVLDFGLARAAGVHSANDAAAAASSPTMLSPAATQQGVILGTAGYMSPEQARGKVADKRADIWAFGVVLYEMLTGTRLFGGDTVTEIIASVIKDAPRLDALPAATPPMLRQLLARCLERDPKLRLRDIGEARVMLSNPAMWAVDTGSSVTPPAPRSRKAAVLIASSLVLAAIAVFATWQLKPDVAANATIPVRRFELPAQIAGAGDFAIAPDGSRLAYFTDGHLYVHDLRTARSTDLGQISPGSTAVFFSPDGRRIAYAGESSLRIVPIEGGQPFTVCQVPATGRVDDGVWLDDGTILFAVWRDNLYRVAATGGAPLIHAAIDPAKEIDFHSVDTLPDNRLLVVTHLRGQDGSRADVIDASGARTPLADDIDIGHAMFVSPDHLVFNRIRTNVGVWTVPFRGGHPDLATATLVEPDAASFAVSDEGTLVAAIDARQKRALLWVKVDETTPNQSRRVTQPLPGATFEAYTPQVAVSPEGRRAVVSSRTRDNKDEYFVRDLATGTDTRVPMPLPSTGTLTGARIAWTPGGRLLYAAGGVETLQIFDWPADGSRNGRPLLAGMSAQMRHDGKEVLVIRDERPRLRLYRAPILADGTAGKAEPVFSGADEPSVRWFDLSPDGTLLAFTATDPTTTVINIFVATYPDLRERRQVTSTGGTQPRFSHDSRQLYFLSGARTGPTGLTRGELNVITVTTKPFGISAPRMLLGDAGTEGFGGPTLGGFDVAADGRLLMTRVAPTAPGDQARTVLLQNWMGSIAK